MVQCFHPECNHQSERDGCKMFYFPNPEKKKKEYKRWLDLIRYVIYCPYEMFSHAIQRVGCFYFLNVRSILIEVIVAVDLL